MQIDNIQIGTTILISIQVFVFLVNKFLYRGKLMKWGEGNSKAVFEDHEYWRLITAAFLHTKLYHIAANVIMMFIAGKLIEPMIGTVGLLLVFLISNAITYGVFLRKGTIESSIGASPGIYALLAIILFFCFENTQLISEFYRSGDLNTLIIIAVVANLKGIDTLYVHNIGFTIGLVAGGLWLWL